MGRMALVSASPLPSPSATTVAGPDCVCGTPPVRFCDAAACVAAATAAPLVRTPPGAAVAAADDA